MGFPVNPHQSAIRSAMGDPDRYVLAITYRDAFGDVTERIVSPTKWVSGRSAFMAVCLGREEPRMFYVARIQSSALKQAHDVLMPEPVQRNWQTVPPNADNDLRRLQ